MTSSKRIVIVDDEPFILRLLQKKLASSEFEAITFTDPRRALEAAREAPPDLFISDVRMPGMDGLAFLEATKKTDALKHVPFIFLSGIQSDPEISDSLEKGADGYLTKPVSDERLLAKIRATLRLASRLPPDDQDPNQISGSMGEDGVLPLLKYCEEVSLTGRLTVESDGRQVWGEFVKGELVRARQTPGDPEGDATEALLSFRTGNYRVEQSGLDASLLKAVVSRSGQDAADSPRDQAPAHGRIPVGRLGMVDIGATSFQVQTEAENRPNLIVTTVVVVNGQVVRKFESEWSHPLRLVVEEASARDQIDRQHDRVVALLRQRKARSAPPDDRPDDRPDESSEREPVAPAGERKGASRNHRWSELGLADPASPALAGRLSHYSFGEILSVLEVTRSTGWLDLRAPDREAVVGFDAGKIVHAAFQDLKGSLAAFVIATWESGWFAFWPGPAPEERHGIGISSQSLCLEAMRIKDASDDDILQFVPTSEAVSPPPGLGARERAVLEELDAASSVDRIARRCGITRFMAMLTLEELEKHGLVQRRRNGEADSERLRVLLVDDSRLMQKALKRLYESEGDIVVAGIASNGAEALEMLPALRPDLVCLDLHMPVMNGVAATERIMATRPVPIVLVTSASAGELDMVLESILDHGAVDFITKPAVERGTIKAQGRHILSRLRKAALVNLRGLRWNRGVRPAVTERSSPGRCEGAIAVTGGTGACASYLQLLTGLPANLRFAVVGNLSFPKDFLEALVAYLSSHASFQVKVATDGAKLEGGVCYLGTHGQRLTVEGRAGAPALRVAEVEDEPDSPGLFRSVARVFGEQAVGLLLSGEALEITAGLVAIREAGGITLAQMPESCMCPEQCEQALAAELIDRAVSPSYIAGGLTSLLSMRRRGEHSRFSAGPSEATLHEAS